MTTDTDLRIEYVELSWNHDFPERIEIALENDYVANKHLYDQSAFSLVTTHLLIAPDASPESVLQIVRSNPSQRERSA